MYILIGMLILMMLVVMVIYNNVINGLSHNKTNIVLMHDSANHRSTVNALRDIIRYGKDNGYSFKAITNDTPVVRHGVNN